MYPELLHFRLAGFDRTIQSYGVLVLAGAAVAILISIRRAPRYGVARFDELAVGLLGFAGGIVGGVLLYFAVHAREILAEPSLLKTPGLVFYGGLAGGAIAGWLYCRKWSVPVAAVADAGAPGLALGHAIGRIGCLMGGCCYGRECDAPLAIVMHGVPRHPVQLYEAVGLGGLALLLFALSRALAPKPGALFLLYICGYAALRLATERFRGDDLERGFVWVGVLSTSQAIAAGVLVLAALALMRSMKGAR